MVNVRKQHEEPPMDDDLHAGEFVLGLLERTDHAAAQARVTADPSFARHVEAWQSRLNPLFNRYAPVIPPARVWTAVQARIGSAPAARRQGAWNNVGFWRAVAAAAVVLAVLAVRWAPDWATGQREQVAAVDAGRPVTPLRSEAGSALFLAVLATGHAALELTPVPESAPTDDKVPELWLIPPGGAPQSLGLISPSRTSTVEIPTALREQLQRGAVLAVSLEPPGGAPGGAPTGPVIATGEVQGI